MSAAEKKTQQEKWFGAETIVAAERAVRRELEDPDSAQFKCSNHPINNAQESKGPARPALRRSRCNQPPQRRTVQASVCPFQVQLMR